MSTPLTRIATRLARSSERNAWTMTVEDVVRRCERGERAGGDVEGGLKRRGVEREATGRVGERELERDEG